MECYPQLYTLKTNIDRTTLDAKIPLNTLSQVRYRWLSIVSMPVLPR